jgi:hypothetical protein
MMAQSLQLPCILPDSTTQLQLQLKHLQLKHLTYHGNAVATEYSMMQTLCCFALHPALAPAVHSALHPASPTPLPHRSCPLQWC